MTKKKTEPIQLPPELTISKAEEKKIHQLLEATRRKTPNFWDEGISESFYVPVENGEIRVLHVKPQNPVSKRPVVFVPGWGGLPEGYVDYYEVVHDLVEFYYVETREKHTSRLDRKKAKMDMDQKAKDVQDVINHLGFDKTDFVLFGTCWGGAIVLHGLINKIIKAPTIVVHDPMHTLWFPKWILNYLAPFLPVFAAEIIKPILAKMQLRGMKEEVQRKRADAFIENAEAWKWKKASLAVKDFELFGKLSAIEEEVFVNNGTQDKIHEQTDYPKTAKEIPNGRFLFLKTDESRRERLMGLIVLEFSKVLKEDGIPPSLAEFEKKLKRE